MKSKITVTRSFDGFIRFEGIIADSDIARVKLDAVDRALFDDCMGTDRSAADWLLGLELLFRRMEEQL